MPSPADSWQILIALIWPIVQEWIKNSPAFSWFSKQTSKANAALSVVVAALTTVGFHFAWTGSAAVGWSLTLAIPAVSALKHTAGAWVLQHIAYKQFVKNPAMQVQIAAHLKVLRMLVQPMPGPLAAAPPLDVVSPARGGSGISAPLVPEKHQDVQDDVVRVVKLPPSAEPFYGPPR